MLLVLTGSSGAGKTTLARGVARPGLRVHDFDEVGVPSDADTVWRQRTGEHWLRQAIAIQAHGDDLLLTGQSPLGEILATPSATALDGIAICLVDVAEDERHQRLAGRDPDLWSAAQLDAFAGWARWQRGHARDPQYHPEVIVDGGWPAMRWDRWRDWTAADSRWHTTILDTTGRPVDESTAALAGWVDQQRAAQRAGTLALASGWND